MAEVRMSEIFMVLLSVLMIGAVWVVLGRMLVTLFRRLLLDGLPEEQDASKE